MVKTTIKLQNFASYSPTAPVTVTLTKPVAVFYGHNGVGKSTIAKAVRHHLNPSLGSAGGCSIAVDGLAKPEFLIYDAEYIEDNFHAKEGKGIRGIFTLGKKTGEELDQIQQTDDELRAITSDLQAATDKIAQLDTELEKAFNQAKESTWTIKADYEKGPLRFCLEEHKVRGDKAKLFQHLSSADDGDGSIKIEELLRDALEIEDETAEKKIVITMPTDSFSEIEANALFGRTIVGSTDSRLSALIGTLKNEGWVRNGRQYLHEGKGLCPFCQQSVPHDFESEVSKLFDTAYESQCNELGKLRDSYRSATNAFIELLVSAPYQDEYVTSDLAFQNACKDLRLILERNLTEIDKKIEDPGTPVVLASSTDAFINCRDLSSLVIAKIIDYNTRISNRDQVKKGIDQRFWKRMRHDQSVALASYNSETNRISSDRTEAIDDLDTLKLRSQETSAHLRELRTSSTNIDASIDSINQRMLNIGIHGFRIEKDSNSEGYYHIARGAQGKIDYKSLSEGEKNLITFLYFLQSLEGSHSTDGNANKPNRIVVIDDPVSSLSHNHVYDIASLITINLIASKFYPLVVILTHRGSTPLVRTLQISPIMGQEECHGKTSEVQRRVQA